jgi:hypothetical protein
LANGGNFEKIYVLKLNRLANSQWQSDKIQAMIENEGISRDVPENKRTKYVREPVCPDVDEK